MRARLGWMLVASALGCASRVEQEDPPKPTAPIVAGSRLRAHVIAAEGARSLVDWYDSVLDEHCTFRSIGDGRYECLPLDGFTLVVYLDAACTEPALVTAPGSCSDRPAKLARDRRRNNVIGCSEPWTEPYYSATSEVVVAKQTWIRTVTGGCAPRPPDLGETLLRAKRVPPGTFVTATISREPRDGAIDAAVLVASDGTRQLISAWDRARNAVCHVVGRYLATDDRRCISERVAWMGGNYADAACSQAAAYTGATCTPAVVVTSDDTTCAPPSLFEAGAPLSSAFRRDGGSCSRVDDGGYRYVSVGAPITVPTLDLLRVGDGAVQLELLGAGGGAVAATAHRFRDRARDVPCTPRIAGGTLRCVPSDAVSVPDGGVAGRIFADAACTQRLVPVYVGPCARERTASFVVTQGACDRVVRVHRAGPVHDGPLYVALSASRCEPKERESTYRYQLVGEEVSLDAFPKLRETIE